MITEMKVDTSNFRLPPDVKLMKSPYWRVNKIEADVK
jgi:hypothetical protein